MPGENNPPQLPLLPLLDVQNLEDQRGIDITWVGIRDVEIPVTVLEKDGKTQRVGAIAALSVGLGAQYKGTHMSRFVEQLAEWSAHHVMTLDLREFLADTKRRLKASTAKLELKFRYFINKKAPATGHAAPMAYGCRFVGSLCSENRYRLILGITVPVTTLCPCSKEISDYGAHNQRSEIRVQVVVDPEPGHRVVWIEDLVEQLEKTASCPVYPLLKRPDEKWVTEQAYNHPMFVEDVIREATLLLRNMEGVKGFHIEVEAFESIHAHNAWAEHDENFPR